MKIETLRDLFMLKIMALYDIETQIVKALPKMAKASDDVELKAIFEDHLEETEEHVKRLEQIFDILKIKPKKMKVEAIRGLIADAEWIIKEKPSPNLLDAVLVGSASYVEHYEMAGYLTAIAWAEILGLSSAAKMLQMTLDEENNAEASLSEAAQTNIDGKAMGMKMEEDEEPDPIMDADEEKD